MPTPEARLASSEQEIKKYNRRLLWLAGSTAAVLVVLVLVTLIQVARIADEAKESATEANQQTLVVRQLLERQVANDADRQRLIDEAVSAIAAEQYRALVAHDRRTEELLRRNGRLLEREVNSPANMENQPVTVIPAPMLRVAPRPAPAPQVAPAPKSAPAPRVGPPTGATPTPAPSPKPQPQPSPCKPRGKSGKCKR